MTNAFSGNDYVTPAGVPQSVSELLLFRSRWSVYSHFFGTIIRSSSLARRGLYDDEAWADSSFEIMGNLERCGARFEIEGLDKVRAAQGPLVLVSNHMGTLETVVLPGLIRPMKPITFVVKRKLLGGVIWGPIMRSRDPIAVSRKDPRADLEAEFPGVPRFEIANYSEHALSAGEEAAAIAYIQIKPADGRTRWGAGVDTNIELASVRAILSALNRS